MVAAQDRECAMCGIKHKASKASEGPEWQDYLLYPDKEPLWSTPAFMLLRQQGGVSTEHKED